MTKLILSLIILHLSWLLQAQPQNYENFEKKFLPKSNTIYYQLGNRTIQLKTFQYSDAKDLVMINLHADETTSVASAQKFLEVYGGLLIKIENNNRRNIHFRLGKRNYTFDPNRIFSREGITQTLKDHDRFNEAAADETEKFANRILQLVPENLSCIIALHNNTDAAFSVTSYLPGNVKEADAKKVYADSLQDADDLFLTTDSLLYCQLSAGKYNTIWQDNENARKDGSLSVYCGEKGIRYLNCETQHGKTSQYFEMLMTAINYLERVNAAVKLYNYTLTVSGVSPDFSHNEIYFGDKRIGMIRTINTDTATGKLYGKMEIAKNFPLYTNMDFFLFPAEAGDSKIELRIDPTREKKQLKPTDNTIGISVKKSILN